MALTPQDIGRIAHLARLELAPQESERMLTQLNDFFSIVEAMQAVDTSGVTPLPHPAAVIQDVHLRLLEPLMVLLLGGLVGTVLMGIFLPLYQLIGNLG